MRFLAFCVLAGVLVLATMARTPAADEGPEKVGGKVLEDWLKQTKSFDPSVRENAVRALMQFGKDARKALPTVVNLMGDPDLGVSTNALIAFRAMANDKDIKAAVTPLTKALQSPSPVAKLQASMSLAQLGPDGKAAIKPLMELVRYPLSWEMRKTAAMALGRVSVSKDGPDPVVVRVLTDAFAREKEACAQVRMQAIMSLGVMQAHKSSTGAPIIKHPLDLAIRNDSDQLVVLWARVLHAQIEGVKPEQHVTYVANLMQKSTDPLVRGNAVQGLAVMGPLAKAYVPNIIRMLKDEDPGVSGVAANAIGQIKEMLTDKQIGDIANMLQDPVGLTRAQAAAALAQLGPEKAKRFLPELISLLKDEDAAQVASAAINQLKEHVTDKHIGDIAALLNDKDGETRCQAARMLAILGDKGKPRIPDLVNVLLDKDNNVVICVILALASFGNDAEKAVPTLNRLKDHKDENVRELAAKAIDEITGKALMK